jgi:hypothetical protein
MDCGDPDCELVVPCDYGWPEICGNLIDDDFDGAPDCMDLDCTCWIGCTGIEWAPEDCDNGVDDDWDGRTDADDFDCPRSCGP